jgi:hypothetical protein
MSPLYYGIITNPDVDQLERIYNQYCVYKKFRSVMPIFEQEYTDPNNDVIGYYDYDCKLVAFSLIRRYNSKNAEAVQFAWDYQDPKLKLGYASLRNECAVYKARGFDYLYLGGADEYKRQIDGFEILGPRT